MHPTRTVLNERQSNARSFNNIHPPMYPTPRPVAMPCSRKKRPRTIGHIASLGMVLTLAAPAFAQVDTFDFEPIRYASSEPTDPLALLNAKLESGDVTLDYDERLGYLPALLKALDIDPDSQMLVYSKTSFQLKRIAPRTPRAVYFNDLIYVGYVAGGDVLEISSVDPKLGGVFYTLNQRPRPAKTDDSDATDNAKPDAPKKFAPPKVTRRFGECLQCHAGAMTQSVPGHMVRSVHTDADGFPILTASTHVTTHRSPVAERWGGWYVTGTHGRMTHLGNTIIPEDTDPETVDRSADQNVVDLADRIAAGLYLRPTSDIVALMVLEHQAQMQNLLTRAAYQTRIALDQQADINRMAERPIDFITDSTRRRIARHGEALLRYMLFVDEAYLKDPIKGTTDFAARFQKRGVRDSKGRSLRQLDLDGYLFEYPCSYLIHSPQFDQLPPLMKSYIYNRLFDILTGRAEGEDDDDFVIKESDRRAIYEMLLETKDDLPEQWTVENKP